MTFVKQFSNDKIFEQRFLLSEARFDYWFTLPDILGYIPIFAPDAILEHCLFIDGKHYVKVVNDPIGTLRNPLYFANFESLPDIMKCCEGYHCSRLVRDTFLMKGTIK